MSGKGPLRYRPGLISSAVVFLLAAALGVGAKADDSPPGTQRLSVNAGAAFPTSANGFSSSARTGPTGGVSYLKDVGDFFGAGLQADYYHFDAKEHELPSAAGGFVNTRSQDDIATLEIMGRYIPLPEARIRPYFHGGTGLAIFRQTSTGVPAPGDNWSDENSPDTQHREKRRLQNKQSVGASLSIGVGAETNVSRRFILGIEAAWHVFEVDRSAFGTSTLNVPTLSVRISRRFGQEPQPASN